MGSPNEGLLSELLLLADAGSFANEWIQESRGGWSFNTPMKRGVQKIPKWTFLRQRMESNPTYERGGRGALLQAVGKVL